MPIPRIMRREKSFPHIKEIPEKIGSYIGTLISRWGHILKGERKQLLAAGAAKAGWSSKFCIRTDE